MKKSLYRKLRAFLHATKRSIRNSFKIIIELEKEMDNEESKTKSRKAGKE